MFNLPKQNFLVKILRDKFFNLLHGIIAFGSLTHPPRLALQTWNCPYSLA
jgi:hypothetical protein